MPLLVDHPDLSLKRITRSYTIPIQAATKVNLFKTTGQQILWIVKLKLSVPVNMTFPVDSLILDDVPLSLPTVAAGTTQYLATTLTYTTTETAVTQQGQEPVQIRRSLDLIIAVAVAPSVLTLEMLALVADDTDNDFQSLSGPPNVA